MILIEITAATDSLGNTTTFFVSDDVFVTGRTDLPSDTAFEPAIEDPGSLAIFAWGEGRTGGGSELQLGEIKLKNGDGRFDAWKDYSFDGRPVIIRSGEGGAYPGAFPAILYATADGVEVTFSAVTIRLRARGLIFDRPVLTTRYAGSNVLPNGLEGVAGDLKGKAKPKVYGKVREASPYLVNTSKLTYQVHDGALASIDGVYVQGVAITPGVDHATSALLQAATISPGTYQTCLAEGYFRLGATPTGEVTCDATQGASAADRTVAQILQDLALSAGLLETEIAFSDVEALDAANPAVVGIYVTEEMTHREAMDAVAASIGAYYAFDAYGLLRMGRLLEPELPAVADIQNFDSLSGTERRPASDLTIPAWRVTVRHTRYWTTQTSDLAGSITAVRKAELAEEYRRATAEDAQVKTQFLNAADHVVDTLLTSAADADVEAARLRGLYRLRRDIYDAPVPLQAYRSWVAQGLRLMSTVRLTLPRFGLESGKLFRLLGVTLDLGRNQAVLTLWGPGQASPSEADLTAPTITSSASVTVSEGQALAHVLTADEVSGWSIVSGADADEFEISSSTLRWSSNGTRDYEAPADTNGDNVYSVTVRAMDAAGNSSTQTITVTVTDVSEGGGTEDPGDPDTWPVVFEDDSTRPLSIRKGKTSTISDGVTTWGEFSYYAMTNNAVGVYNSLEWTEGYATADPHQLDTRRDDQTVLLNIAAETVRSTGYMHTVRDMVAGVTTMRAQRKANTNASGLSPSADGWGRGVTDFLGAQLNTKYSVTNIAPPYMVETIGFQPPPEDTTAYWYADWLINSTSHQATTPPTGTTADRVDGPHSEFDFVEGTGINLSNGFMRKQFLFNQVWDPGSGLTGWDGVIPDMGEVISNFRWDKRTVVLTDKVQHYLRKHGATTWVLIHETGPYPVGSPFATEPGHMQIDLKGGMRSYDASADWVGNVDGSTPDYTYSWKIKRLYVPSTNTSPIIDVPADWPALAAPTWLVDKDAIDNSVADGTVLANLTAMSGITYEVKPAVGLAISGNTIIKSGSLSSGTREVTVWAYRASDQSWWAVSTQQITVLNNVAWWDDAAKVSLNFESSEVMLGGVPDGVGGFDAATAGTWSDYINGSGQPTALLQSLMPGFAAAGVAVWKGTGASANPLGLYGYNIAANPPYPQFAIQFQGSASPITATVRTTEDFDRSATIASMASSASPFGIGVSWALTGAKVCGNGGAVTSTASPFPTTGATGAVIWRDGFGGRNFDGTKQRLFIYDPDDLGGSAGALVSDAILQGVSIPAS